MDLLTTSQCAGKDKSFLKDQLGGRQLWAVLAAACLAEQLRGMGGREGGSVGTQIALEQC